MAVRSISTNPVSAQSASQRRNGGGVGRCEQSFIKLETIDKYLNRILPVLLSKRGPGMIIDMHAGDGETTPYPIPDFFSGGKLICTPALVIRLARKHQLDVVLCERSTNTRQRLIDQYGNAISAENPTIISNHNNLVKPEWIKKISDSNWVIILNDPNGYGEHGLEIMRVIAEKQRFSDFIVVFNKYSLSRVLGVKSNATIQCAGCIRSGIENEWMLTPDEWRLNLGKKQILVTELGRLSSNMYAIIMLISNYIPGVHR